MTHMRLGRRDLAATFWVAVAATLYLLVRSGVDVPGLHAERPLAGVMLVLGMLACGAGARQDAFTGPATAGVVFLRMVGAAALVVGVLAVIVGTASMTDAFAALVLCIWVGATLRHLLTPAPPVVETTVARTKELVS